MIYQRQVFKLVNANSGYCVGTSGFDNHSGPTTAEVYNGAANWDDDLQDEEWDVVDVGNGYIKH
jgi:hypothetical protein